MLDNMPHFPVSDRHVDAEFFVEVNSYVDELNVIINEYNKAAAKDKPEILMELHRHFRLVDSRLNGLSAFMAYVQHVFDYDAFYAKLDSSIQAEFVRLGLNDYRDSAINEWDIARTKTNLAIPSATRFREAIKPGFLSRVVGGQNSNAIKRVEILLDELRQSEIKDNTPENYLRLTNLKNSIREIISTSTLSSDEKKILRNLVASINYRLDDMLSNNPRLHDEVTPYDLDVAKELANANKSDVTDIADYLMKADDFDEAEFHRKFDSVLPDLQNYRVTFLGGVNAKNYKLENPLTGEQYVIKVTPEMGSSKKTAFRLQNTSVNNGLSRVYAAHDRIGVGGKLVSLEITEFCSKGDLLSYAKTINNADEKLASAVELYGQMSDLLLDFSANNALFPDMKPTNFLVNQHGKLVVADKKSFVDTKNGAFNRDECRQTQFYLYTQGMEPPEMAGRVGISDPDKHHAYLFGISLYLYLTDGKVADVPNQYDPNFCNFNHPIFHGRKGQQFENLIKGLLEKDPNNRLGMSEAKQKLSEIGHVIKVENSSFRSKPEAYFYAIHELMKLETKHKRAEIKDAIAQLKVLVENHEQDPKVAAKIVSDLASQLDKVIDAKEIDALNDIANAIKSSSYVQTSAEKYENPLGRRFESEMQIALLRNPTKAMMTSVGLMSDSLLNVIAQLEASGQSKRLEAFLIELQSGKEQTGFGSQPNPIDLERLKQILKDNKPEELNQILFIQFLFAQKHMRDIDVKLPHIRVPTGKMLEIVKAYNNGEFADDPEGFFKNMDYERIRLIDTFLLYSGPLFQADRSRGRSGGLPNETFCSQMGVMLRGQSQDGLPTDISFWTPDSKYQAVDLGSSYAKDLYENDTVFVAGPSGMTSLFLGLMENYGNFTSVDDKQNYFAAVSAYMISGGLHSLHEVISPAQYALDLVPGYHVQPPDPNILAQPPNYHQFYQQQMALDPDFKARYDAGWQNMMAQYAKEQHLYVHRPVAKIDSSSMVQRVAAVPDAPRVDMRLTSTVAAERFTEILKESLTNYETRIKGQAPTTHTTGLFTPHSKDGIKRADVLLLKAREQAKLEGVLHHVNEYFMNTLTDFAGGALAGKSRASDHSYVSYLLNELKKEPDLIKFINQHNAAGDELKLDVNIDYTDPSATQARQQAFKVFQSLNVPPIPDSAPVYQKSGGG